MDCVFCKIVSGEVSAHKVWENEVAVAVLDIFPQIRGQVALIYKKHISPDVYLMDDGDYSRFYLAAKQAALAIKKALKVTRIAQITEGLEVNHAHIKLFPVYSVDEYAKKIHTPATKMLDAELTEIQNLFEGG